MKMGRERDRLAMIAGAGADHAVPPFVRRQLRHEVQATSNLERAGGVVIFVLHPDVSAQPVSQECVPEERRWPHVGVDASARLEHVAKDRKGHAGIMRAGLTILSGGHSAVEHRVADAHGRVGPVCNQSIDSPFEEPFHVGFLVHGPHLDP